MEFLTRGEAPASLVSTVSIVAIPDSCYNSEVSCLLFVLPYMMNSTRIDMIQRLYRAMVVSGYGCIGLWLYRAIAHRVVRVLVQQKISFERGEEVEPLLGGEAPKPPTLQNFVFATLVHENICAVKHCF